MFPHSRVHLAGSHISVAGNLSALTPAIPKLFLPSRTRALGLKLRGPPLKCPCLCSRVPVSLLAAALKLPEKLYFGHVNDNTTVELDRLARR